jgi:hypothetical protein
LEKEVRMKTLIVAVAVAASSLFAGGPTPAALACGPTNGCDAGPEPPLTAAESQFIADMKDVGVTAPTGSDRAIMSAGYLLCEARWTYWDAGMGFPPGMMDGLLRTINYRDFNEIMALATSDLCPTKSKPWGGHAYVGY